MLSPATTSDLSASTLTPGAAAILIWWQTLVFVMLVLLTSSLRLLFAIYFKRRLLLLRRYGKDEVLGLLLENSRPSSFSLASEAETEAEAVAASNWIKVRRSPLVARCSSPSLLLLILLPSLLFVVDVLPVGVEAGVVAVADDEDGNTIRFFLLAFFLAKEVFEAAESTASAASSGLIFG